MGIYFYFTNMRTKTTNKQRIFDGPFNIYWYAGFHYCGEEEQREVFRKVITLNADWLERDTILARPDSDYYGIQYDDGVLSYVAYEDTQLFEEDV